MTRRTMVVGARLGLACDEAEAEDVADGGSASIIWSVTTPPGLGSGRGRRRRVTLRLVSRGPWVWVRVRVRVWDSGRGQDTSLSRPLAVEVLELLLQHELQP